jgi:D-glycero-alpha-D-manno-heptose-7-phosphate kinase
MIVTKTPLRVSFFGGGSDIEAFYSEYGGAVLTSTIDKYIRLSIQRVARSHIKVMYSDIERVHDVENLKHDRVRESLKMLGIHSNVEIASFADIPTKGTGLGSSSTFTVGLLQGLSAYVGLPRGRYDLAELACEVEIERCNQQIGKQDQYASTFGGFNFITFDRSGIEVVPLNIRDSTVVRLCDNLMCFYTGQTRNATDILTDQVGKLQRSEKDTVFLTKELVDIAETARVEMQAGRLDNVGHLLDDGWRIKKKLSSGISNPMIDQMYEDAKKAGALGGKILGAGGGGYMLLYVPPKYQTAVADALSNFSLFCFKFTDEGSRVVYNDEPDVY